MGKDFVKCYEKMSNEELVSLIKNGEYQPLGEIIGRHMSVINYYAKLFGFSEADREDLVQEGLLALYNAVKSYQPHKAAFTTFASLCIRRAIYSAAKLKNHRDIIPEDLISSVDDTIVTDNKDPERIFFEKEDFRLLTDSIKVELSALEYRVLRLFLSGNGYAAIADKLGISVKSVDNSLKRIRSKLRKR